MKKGLKVYAVRDDGRKFYYEGTDWRTLKLTGVDFAEIETFKSPRGVGDGDIVTGQRRVSREIGIEAQAIGVNIIETARAQATAFHNIKYRYDVHVEYNGIHRVAKKCTVTASSLPTTNIHDKPKLTVVFLAEEPDLFSSEAVEEGMIERSSLWVLPRYYADNHDLIFATESQATDRVIVYEGTNPAPVKIGITASGYVKNPTISIGNQSCTINKELRAGDVLTINSEETFAKFNGSLIPYAQAGNFDMRQFRVFSGENRISFRAEQGDAFNTSITYTGRYDGV